MTLGEAAVASIGSPSPAGIRGAAAATCLKRTTVAALRRCKREPGLIHSIAWRPLDDATVDMLHFVARHALRSSSVFPAPRRMFEMTGPDRGANLAAPTSGPLCADERASRQDGIPSAPRSPGNRMRMS